MVDKRAWRHPIHWLDKDTSVFYPYALGSYALWRDQRHFPFSRDDVTIFGDSGGYTLVTQSATMIDPTEVIHWQIENCTRGVILDVPPYRPNSAIQFRGAAGEYWTESILATESNVRRAEPIYREAKYGAPVSLDAPFNRVIAINPEDQKFSWWGVVQGENRDQMEEWHARIAAIYPFNNPGEGWALAPKPSTDLLSCTRYMRFAHDKGLRNVHLLQVTAEKTVGLILALAAISGQFDLVTYDSASALRCAINRSAIVPEGIGMGYIKEVSADGDNTVLNFMRGCTCQACQWLREDEPLSNAEYPHYILLHNHLIMLASFELMFKVAQLDPDRLLRWATKDSGLYGAVLQEWDRSISRPKAQSRVVPMSERI